MKEQIRLATKAQAQAVRDYLATLGVTLSHTQALEVLARGQGVRSRHVLAAQSSTLTPDQWVDRNVSGSPGLLQAMKNHARAAEGAPRKEAVPATRFTKVSYRYVDGSNCKRYSQVVFRGRLTVDQLKFIAWKLDDGQYFVPAQIGLECLAFTFSDFGGDDHGWHTLEVGDPDSWELDGEGFVLRAGDVEQVFDENAAHYATDADCANLFFRFAMLRAWDPHVQSQLLGERGYQLPQPDDEDESAPLAESVAAMWRLQPALERCTPERLEAIYNLLRREGFEPRLEVPHMLEWTREMGPNAYQFVILQECPLEVGELALNADVSTHSGRYVTESPLVYLGQRDAQRDLQREMADLHQVLDGQKRKALTDPWAWTDDFV